MSDSENLDSKIRSCTLCRLSSSRKRAVPGEGKIPAKIMLVGEAPGKNEDIEGRPFVGEAGKLLNQCLQQVGIERASVYITNVVKCRPPNNRKPFPDEIKTCTDAYLFAQISIVDPVVIVALGVSAAEGLGLKFNRIKEVIGNHKLSISGKERNVYVAYHPSFPLRFKSMLPQFIEQLSEAKRILENETN
ncbi:MAG: uracil-DNA glycosylase [Conexivisphaerales archaeon]